MDKHVYVNLSFVGDQENILLMRLTAIKRSITGPSLLTASQRE